MVAGFAPRSFSDVELANELKISWQGGVFSDMLDQWEFQDPKIEVR